MIYTHLIAALLSAVMAFTGGWKINQWRHDSEQKQAIEQAAAQQRELHALEQKRSSGVIAAQNDARKRETGLRRDAAAAVTELDGLRASSAGAVSRARASYDACLVTSLAATELLNQCGAAYQDLGATADRHVSDVQTLSAAWPK